MAGEARKGGKKGRKIGRNITKCQRYAAKHGMTAQRRHASKGSPTPIQVAVSDDDGATCENVPVRVRRDPGGYTVCLPFSFFKDADHAEICSRLGLSVLT